MIPSSSHHPVVCYGEILWDVLPDKTLPGGAPMNVAYHLNKLGVSPAMITRIGRDNYGQKLVKLLADSGIDTRFIQTDETHATGLVTASIKEHNEMEYDIVQPVAWDFIEWEDSFAALLRQASYLVYGSLTSRSDVSRNTLYQLLDMSKTKVLDINLRPPHFSRSHIEYLLGKTDLLKLNAAELELVAGWYSNVRQNEDRMKLLQDRFHIETIMVTMGGEGALLVSQDKIYRHGGYKVQVADTIGSGDAFLAGYLSQVIQGAHPAIALAYACGAGAFIASQSGACPTYHPSQIEAVMKAYAQQPVSSL